MNSKPAQSIKEYGIALAVALAIFSASALINFSQLKTFSPTIINRGLADASIILLALALLLGPLSRLYNLFDKYILYRKEFGILAFFTGAIHVYLAMFPLARHGPWGFYQSRPFSAYPGLAGLIIMFLLFLISFAALEKKLGTARWWKLQYLGGRLAGLGVLTHIAVFRWNQWLEVFAANKPLPTSFFVGAFSFLVLFIKLTEHLGTKAAKIFIPLLTGVVIALLLSIALL